MSLDKCVLKPVKNCWNKLMINYNRDFPGQLLPNDEFLRKLKIVYEESFKYENILSGFRIKFS